MGGGSGVEVHWPNLIDSNLCAISGGYGSGPQMQMGGSFVDDYSLAMAAPAALWSGGMAPSAAPVSASVCAPAGAQGTGLSAGLVNFTSSQLHFGSGAGFGFGLGSGGSLNMPGMNMSMSMAQSGSMGLVSPEPTLFEMVNAVPQSLRALGPGFGAGGMLDMAGAMQQHQQQQQPLDSPGLGLGSGCSAAAGAFALQPELEAAELVGVAGNGDLHALPPMSPLLGGGLGDGAAASLLNMAVNVALPMPMPMPMQQGPGLGEGSNDGLFGLPAGMSMPMEAGVSGSGAGGSFMDLAARFQLNSFTDLADLSAITSQPLNYILQQDPGAGMQPMVSAVGPRIGGVPDNIPAPAPPPPPLRFADLNVTSIPYDSRYRQPCGASVPPGMLFLKAESKLDHGFPGSPLHAGGGIGRAVGVGGLGLGLGGGVLPGGSLVLDGARSELINISKMTPQEILDAKALAASKSHSEAERRRRERINTHLGTLRTMLPSSTKTDKASLLGEVIEHVKELKRQAADIDGPVPTEVDELGVEMSEASEKHPGKLIIKLTVCCDDRPGLLSAIGRAVEACKLDNFSVELSTLAGRLKVVMLAACTESVQEAKQDAVMSSLQEAVRAALDKVGPATAAATSTRTNSSGSSGGLKRQRTGVEASSPSN